jgi:hypothetical protein
MSITVLTSTESGADSLIDINANFADLDTTKADGAASSTDNAIARFDGITGKVIQDSLITVSDASGTNVIIKPISKSGTGYGIVIDGGVSTDDVPGATLIKGGNATATDKNGGALVFQGGAKNGSGSDGQFVFYANPTSTPAILNFSSIASSNKTFTFPNETGTFALRESANSFTREQIFRGSSSADNGIYGCIWNDDDLSPYTMQMAGYTLSLNTGENSARTSRLYITTAGQIGVGTTSPTDFGAGYTGITVQASTGGFVQCVGDSGVTKLEMITGGSLGTVGTRSNSALMLKTNDTGRAVFDTGTNLTLACAVNYAADAVGTDSYAVTLGTVITAYITGMQVTFKAQTANTGAASLNVNSLGAKTIVKGLNTALANNDILAGMFCLCIYDGTNFVLMNPRTL